MASGHSAQRRRDILLAHPVHRQAEATPPGPCLRPPAVIGLCCHWERRAIQGPMAAVSCLRGCHPCPPQGEVEPWRCILYSTTLQSSCCGKGRVTRMPSSPRMHGRTLLIWERFPCGYVRARLPCVSGLAVSVSPSPAAPWRRQCHVGGQGHACSFQPCSRSARMSTGHSQGMEPSVHCYGRMLISWV